MSRRIAEVFLNYTEAFLNRVRIRRNDKYYYRIRSEALCRSDSFC